VKYSSGRGGFAPGFTLIEFLVGGLLMLIVVTAALSLYVKSNKISADQQQFIEIQNDVRAAMFFIARDLRMAGAGLPAAFGGHALQGWDNESTGTAETPDRLLILGAIEEPLILPIRQYQGSAASITLWDGCFEQQPYPDDYYIGKTVLALPNPSSACRGAALRVITHVTHNPDGTNEKVNVSPGWAPGINLPGGLSDVCPDSDYFDGGVLLVVDVCEYWLDVTGAAAGLVAGQNGYVGGGKSGVLYMTKNGAHRSLAQNIESIQLRYNGDFDADSEGRLDGFSDWSDDWTLDQIGRVRQIQLMILGRTPDRFASVFKVPSARLHLYRRPRLANTPVAAVDDWHKRYLMETTSTIRNPNLNLYNAGMR